MKSEDEVLKCASILAYLILAYWVFLKVALFVRNKVSFEEFSIVSAIEIIIKKHTCNRSTLSVPIVCTHSVSCNVGLNGIKFICASK